MNNWACDCYYLCVYVCVFIFLAVWLFSSDPSQSDSDSKDFWFNMQALTSYLRKASEQSPSASYYNVDILKYQVSQPELHQKNKPDKIIVFQAKTFLSEREEKDCRIQRLSAEHCMITTWSVLVHWTCRYFNVMGHVLVWVTVVIKHCIPINKAFWKTLP